MNGRKWPLRVAVIGARGIPSNYSGIERVCEGLYSALTLRGHKITVYCRPEYLDKKTNSYRGIRLVRTASVKYRELETLSHILTSLGHALLFDKYDIIHLHALAPGLLVFLCRLRGMPVIATIHGLDWQRAKWKGTGSFVLRIAEQMLVRFADQIIVLTHDLKDYFQERYRRGTVQIPNGVDRKIPLLNHDMQKLSKFGLEQGKYLLFVGRLVPEKRIEDLVDAFMLLKIGMKLAIVGEGSYTDKYVSGLHSLAAANDLIIFTGLQSGRALEALYQGAALFVLPSELEGLPMSLLECMAYGKIAVLSDIPPHRELYDFCKDYPLFFMPRDITALANCINKALLDIPTYNQIALMAQEHVRNKYSWHEIAAQTERVYLRALSI